VVYAALTGITETPEAGRMVSVLLVRPRARGQQVPTQLLLFLLICLQFNACRNSAA